MLTHPQMLVASPVFALSLFLEVEVLDTLLLASGVDVAFGVLVGVFVGCVVGIVVGAVVGVVVGAVVGVTVGVSVGVFAYVLWQEKSFLSQILPVFLTSLGFEVIQFIFAIGATDITDLITNTSGGVIGIGIAFVLSKIFKNSWKKCINIVGLVCAVLLSLFILVLLLANL